MTTTSAVRSYYGTLAASTADLITITVNPVDFPLYAKPSKYPSVEVVNQDSAAWLYFTTDGTTPTVGGTGTFSVGPGGWLTVPLLTPVVQVISVGAIAYGVTGLVAA